MKPLIRKIAGMAIMAAILPQVGVFAARAQDQEIKTVTVTDPFSDSNSETTTKLATVVGSGGGGGASFSSSGAGNVIIQSIEPDGNAEPARDVTWLGLAVDETSEALGSQLGLKPGEGLVVNFVAPKSPAEKADFHKNDVLVELDGQMLVDAGQLRKLVEMHAEGDTVKLAFFRAGQKQTIEVKLGKRTAEMEAWRGTKTFRSAMPLMKYRPGNLDNQLRIAEDQLSRVELDKGEMNKEIKRTLDQTVKAIQDSLNQATNSSLALSNANSQLEALTHGGVDVTKDSTVTVRSQRNSTRTVVKTGEDGTIVFVAGAHQHLTARDKEGQVLFDGDIDTAAEQDKVPKDVWEKVKPLLN